VTDATANTQVIQHVDNCPRRVGDGDAHAGLPNISRTKMFCLRQSLQSKRRPLNLDVTASHTTDAFHVYRVTNESGTVSVFVDQSTEAVLAFPHDDFPPDAGTTKVTLANTSNPGVADFDIRRYVVNPNGTIRDTSIPTVSEWGMVAMTLLTLTAGTLVLSRKRIGSFS